MTMAGDAGGSDGVSLPRPTAARLPPPWFRERDAAELQREAAHVARMVQLEAAALAVGYKIRLAPRAGE